jgi:hypothetical protein
MASLSLSLTHSLSISVYVSVSVSLSLSLSTFLPFLLSNLLLEFSILLSPPFQETFSFEGICVKKKSSLMLGLNP